MNEQLHIVKTYTTTGSVQWQLKRGIRVVFTSRSEKIALRALANSWCPARPLEHA